MIISIDGIQSDKGNERIYLVRDVLDFPCPVCRKCQFQRNGGHAHRSSHPSSNWAPPCWEWEVDAQVSEVSAVADLWPDVPHQTCQFHYLREASRPMYDLDQKTRTAMRKTIQSKLRETRNQLRHHLHDLGEATEPEQLAEREQLQILADYATGIQTVLKSCGESAFCLSWTCWI